MAVVSVVGYTAEYAGIAVGMELVGVPPVVYVPIAYVAFVGVVARSRASEPLDRLGCPKRSKRERRQLP